MDGLEIPAFLDRRHETLAERKARADALIDAQPLAASEPKWYIKSGIVREIKPKQARARVVERKGRWYYTIRGGYTGGPFDTEDACRAAAKAAK